MWTYCWFLGWEEAEKYSVTIRKNNISGELLPLLTVEMMKDDLHFTNSTHCSVIKSEINRLFDVIEKKEHVDLVLVPTEPKCQLESKFRLSDCKSMMDWCSSIDTASESSFSRSSSSCYSRRLSSCSVSPSESSVMTKDDPDLRRRELILKLLPQQHDYPGLIKYMEEKFADLNYNVEIERRSTNRKKYIVRFKDQSTALHAFKRAEAIGFKLSKSWAKRPSPKYTVKFKALCELLVREGKSCNSRIIGNVKKYEVITVNQVKGRRARIVAVHNSKLVNFGWVSLHTSEGSPLLERLEEV